MLLKGYFFLLNRVLCRTASPRHCVTISHRSPWDSMTAWRQPPRRKTNPKRQHQHWQRPWPSPLPSPAASAPGANAHPPSETLIPPCSFSASRIGGKAASKGRGKDIPSDPLPQLLFSGSQKQGRARPSPVAAKAAARAHPGVLGGIGSGSGHVSSLGCTAKLTSWSVEEQGLFSGFKQGNYFSARPSQASSTHHTI